jgi:hypothetical protein
MERIAIWMAAAALCALAGCERNGDSTASGASNTAVLGGYGPPRGSSAVDPVTGLPVPPAPRQATPHVVRADRDAVLALWEEQGQVMASRWDGGRWEPAQALEAIAGEASNLRVVGNGNGAAMAVWQHTVGRIDSLRFSAWDSRGGWSPPDVMPGALPRARQPGKTAGGLVQAAAPVLEIDAQGNVRAQWLSGFAQDQVQASTYVPAEGWARPVDLPLQAAAPNPAQLPPR